MSLRIDLWRPTVFALAIIAASFHSHACSATRSVCPSFESDELIQIYLFDGTPQEQAYLAPDGERATSSIYTIENIYKNGGFATVQCKYGSGKSVDIRLNEKIKRCIFTRSKPKKQSLMCE